MIRAIPRFDSWEPQLLQCLLDTATWKFLYAMQENSGTDAKDYSGNGYTGTYDNVSLNQNAPNRRINKTVLFNGSSSKVILPTPASVKGLGAYTVVAVVNIKIPVDTSYIYIEPVNDSTATRISLTVMRTGQLQCLARSAKASQTISTVQANNIILGNCIVHATVDVPNDEIVIYRNGLPLSASVNTVDFGVDTIIEDTDPYSDAFIGARSTLTSGWFSSNLSYVGVAVEKISAPIILQHAKAGGFA